MWVDMAVEVPGKWYHSMPVEASPPKMRASRFFPSMHTHGGGTFKWDGPSSVAARERFMQFHPRPSFRGNVTVRALAARLTGQSDRSAVPGGLLVPTLADAFFLVAYFLKSASFYDADHHKAICIISNFVPVSLAGLQRACHECRCMEAVIVQDVEWHDVHRPRFYMRGELRFMGDRLKQALDDDPPDGIRRAEAAQLLMQQVTAIVFYYQFELFNVGLCYVPTITTTELLLAPSAELAAIDAILLAAKQTLHMTSSQALHHMGFTTMLKLHRHLARARAMLCACSATELAIINAATCLFDLAAHSRTLEPSVGAKRSIARWVKKQEAHSPGSTVTPPPPTKATPRSLLELWRLIATTFDRGTELVALLGMLGASVMVEGQKGKRQTRGELQLTLASVMSKRVNDPTAVALARRIYPRLPAKLVEEVVEAGGHQPAPSPPD